MSYTIVGGALTGNTVWTNGTYYLSGSDLTTSANNLTLDTTNGDIIIKTIGNLSIKLNGAATLSTSGTNNVIFTSKNDDDHGEIIIGSTGVPAIGDQSVGYIFVTVNNTNITLSNIEFWYCEVADGSIIDYGTAAVGQLTNSVMSLTNTILKYCSLSNASVTDSCFFGHWRRVGFLNFSIDGLEIGTTNRILQTGAKGSLIKIQNAQTISIKNSYFNPTCDYVGYFSIHISCSTVTCNITYQNNLMISKFAYAGLGLLSNGVLAILNFVGSFSIFDLVDKTKLNPDGVSNRPAINVAKGATGTITLSLKDSQIVNSNIGLNNDASLSSWDEDYNNFYNNVSDSDLALGTHSLQVNPDFGNLRTGNEIYAGFLIPNGYAVRNLWGLDKKGSDTFNNNSIDESLYSATGKKYIGTDNVTPGINYKVSSFARERLVNLFNWGYYLFRGR